ncbi:MAG TPA: efflux RND transporter periplasmic adaptor subunit [Gemmatimonadales bacterium]
MRYLPRSALLALAIPFHSACARADADDADARPYAVGVAERGDIRVTVEETGIVEPERQIVVKSPISGVVETLAAREGDRVRPGQALARIVPDIAQANTFAQMKSSIAAAEIARENARVEHERAQELGRSGSLTAAELDGRRVAFEQADNALRTAQSQLRLVERSGVATGDRQYAAITAPAGGVVITRGVEEGETVVGGTSAFGGGTELFTIADLSTLLVKAAVNEVDIGKVRVGDSVALTVDAFPGDTVPGIVTLVPPAARLEERVRVFDVEIEARGDAAILRPGMTANVRIAGPVRQGVVRVPVQAVVLDEGKPVIFAIPAGGEPEKRPVRLGLSDLQFVEILEGVAAGDSVALEDPTRATPRGD